MNDNLVNAFEAGSTNFTVGLLSLFQCLLTPPGSVLVQNMNGSDSYSRKCFPASPVSFSVHAEHSSHEFMLMEVSKPQNKAKPKP